MKLSDAQRELIHAWVADELPNITSEDPDSLSSFVVSLLESDTPDPEELASLLREGLNEFLADATESFVSALLQFVEAAASQAEPAAEIPAASRDEAAAAAALPVMTPLPAAVPAASGTNDASESGRRQQRSSVSNDSNEQTKQQQQQRVLMDTDNSHRSRRGDDDDEHEAGQKRKRDNESEDTPASADAQAAKRPRGANGPPAATVGDVAAGRNGRPTKPCFDFQRFGTCRRGASCFFEHVPRQAGDQQPPAPQGRFPQMGGGQQQQWIPPAAIQAPMQLQMQQQIAMQMQMQQQQLLMQQQQLHTTGPQPIRTLDDDETEIPLTGLGAHVTAGAGATSHALLEGGRGGYAGRGGGRGGRGGLGFQQQRMVPAHNAVPFSYSSSPSAAAASAAQSQQRFVSASTAELPASGTDAVEQKDAESHDQQQQHDGDGAVPDDVGAGADDDGPPILSNDEYMASLTARGTFERSGRGRGGGRGGRGGRGGGGRGGFGGDANGGGHEHACKLFLTRVPPELNSLVALAPHFAQFGEIVSIKIVGDDRALVQMGSHAEALAALNSPQAVLGNRFIQVEWARHDGPAGGAGGHPQQQQPREFKPRSTHFQTQQQTFVRAQHQQPQSDSPASSSTATPLSAVDVAKALKASNAASGGSVEPASSAAPPVVSSAPTAAASASSMDAKMASLKALLLQKQQTTQKELLSKLTATDSNLSAAERQAMMKRVAQLNDEIKAAKAGLSSTAAATQQQSAKHTPAAAATTTAAAPPQKLSALEVVARMKAQKAAAAAAANAEETRDRR